MLDYALEVEHYDMHLGKILEKLEAAGQLDNTLIVCTSDHGMPFPRKGASLFTLEPHSTCYPLAGRDPRQSPNRGRP